MIPLQLNQVITAVRGKLIYSQETYDTDKVIISGISTDTRRISNGELFVPLSGENFDGHNFIQQAFNKGAIVCLSEKKDILIPGDKALILVENTKQALMDLASYYRSLFDIPVIAITGSVGKTSTKDMVASVLSQRYNVLKTQGNLNNEIGVPLTIFNLSEEHEVAIIEMGMNRFGEIHNLSKIAKPDIAVITNIGVSHIENLGSREGILRAKCEIFDYLNEDGMVVLNGDDDLLKTLDEKISFKTIYFGFQSGNNIYAESINQKGTDGIEADIITNELHIPVQIPSPGKHMIYNALAAIAIAIQLNLNVEEIKEGVRTYQASKMRMYIFKTKNDIHIINDAYNASPHSMKAAIDVLNELGEGKRKIAILGDMLEMGDYSEQAHKEVGEYAAHKSVEYLFCIGNAAKYIMQGAINRGMDKNKVELFIDQETLWHYLKTFISPQDMILVKGSRGMYLERTVEKIEKVE